MKMPAVWVVLLLALLGGCATPLPSPAPAPAPAPVPGPAPLSAPQTPALKKETLAYLAKRKLTPITGNALNASANCSFRDENGYRGQLELSVRNAAVEQLDARIDVPKHGSCQFRLADFQQTDSQPIVVLAARQGNCKISLWEQGKQVTVAFRNCRTACSGDSVDYLWPILVDKQKGSCS